MRRHESGSRWFRLDNAAKIYPVIMNSRHPTVFRIGALLREPVDPVLLQRAAEQTLQRFPAFKVRLRAGLFWYYLEENHARFAVQPESPAPCRRFGRRGNNRYRLRVLYHDRRIAVELFHALTDGAGGMTFLKTLLAQYVRLQGAAVDSTATILDVHAAPEPEELEDAYARHANFRVIRRPSETPAYHLDGSHLQEDTVSIIVGSMPLERMLAQARAHQVTLTELCVAMLIDEIQRLQQEDWRHHRRPIRVSVPVNMRRHFPSATVRNFSLFANPGIEPAFGQYTFAEIVSQVHHFMRYNMTAKNLNALMCANVRPERSALLRVTPLPLKTWVMRLAYRRSGESRFTTVLSNLGKISLPEAISRRVERLEFMLSPSRQNPIVCAMVSADDKLLITFSSTIRETDLQQSFFRRIVDWGIPVTVESNGWPGDLP